MTEEKLYKIAFGKNRKSKSWENKSITWNSFCLMLQETKRTDETVKEYFEMDKEKRGNIKDIGGFVCGYCEGGRRGKKDITSRSMVTLDIDNKDNGEDSIPYILNIEEVWQRAKLFKCCMYTTHSHTPEEPRLRIITPLDREVTPEEYEKVSKVLAYFIGGKSFRIFDDTTYDVNRLMFLPSTCKDGEYIFRNSCELRERPEAKVENLLKEYDSKIKPIEDNAENKRGDTIQDPTTKNGYIGAFCKAYDIHEAIATYLFNEYIPGSKENRYTYNNGHSGDGLQVFDGGMFAYSHQDTDPISGKGNCNSFDLVRLHKFGDLDSDEDINNLPSNKLPSFKKMCELVVNDDKAKKYLEEEEFSIVEDKEGILHKDFTNDGLLNDFNNTYGQDIKYVSDMEKYIVWNGKVWSISDGKLIHKKIIEYVRNLIDQIEELFKNSDNENIKWIKPIYARLKNLTPIKVIRDNFKGVCSWIKSSDLDNDDNIINCKNGMLNLKTMELLEHKKEALCTKILNIDYEPGVKCDNFFNSLEWIFNNPGTRKELQKAFGYSLIGETIHEVVFILQGKGLNGKSTITKPLIDILGDYYSAIDYKSLEPKKDKAAPSSDFAKLVNKRVVITSEPKQHFTIDDGMLKTFSSGEPLCARFMRQNEFTFNPKAKLWIPTNILPYITNTDFGFWRRLIIFPCFNRPPKDIKGFYNKYIKPKELPGVLNWAIEGLKILQKEGFTPTDEMLKATKTFREDVNPIERFIKEECILDKNEKVRTAELLCNYNAWANDEGYSKMKVRNFRSKIIDLGFEIRKANQNKSFIFGISKVKENIENDFI